MLNRRTFLASMACTPFAFAAETPALPDITKLPSVVNLPDPLIFLDGTKVADKAAWFNKRRPELKQLFQHYMYGYYPTKTVAVTSKVLSHDDLRPGRNDDLSANSPAVGGGCGNRGG